MGIEGVEEYYIFINKDLYDYLSVHICVGKSIERGKERERHEDMCICVEGEGGSQNGKGQLRI